MASSLNHVSHVYPVLEPYYSTISAGSSGVYMITQNFHKHHLEKPNARVRLILDIYDQTICLKHLDWRLELPYLQRFFGGLIRFFTCVKYHLQLLSQYSRTIKTQN